MRRITILAAAVIALGACDTLDELFGGRERRFEVGGFDRISLSGSHEMIVAVGGAPSVRAEGDPEKLARLDVRVVDGELRVRTPFGRGNNRVHGWSDRVSLYVTVPSLVGVRVHGAELQRARMLVEGVGGPRFDASVGGTGDLVLRAGHIGEANFDLRGEGAVHATGQAERTQVHSTSRYDGSFRDFRTRSGGIGLGGSGNVLMHATGEVTIGMTGWGDIFVIGTTRCNITYGGFGTVYCPDRRARPRPWYLNRSPSP